MIAVFGTTRAEVQRAVRHAKTAGAGLPVWAWCTDNDARSADPIEGCDRLTVCSTASDFRKDLSHVWPALSIIAWTGRPGHAALKLAAFTTPPFRVLLFNEAGDFFPANASWIAKHIKRRVKDSAALKAHSLIHLIHSAGLWLAAQVKNTSGRLWSLAWRVANALGTYSNSAFRLHGVLPSASRCFPLDPGSFARRARVGYARHRPHLPVSDRARQTAAACRSAHPLSPLLIDLPNPDREGGGLPFSARPPAGNRISFLPEYGVGLGLRSLSPTHYAGFVSNIIMVTPACAKLARSAAVAWPSGDARAASMAAMSANSSSATKCGAVPAMMRGGSAFTL